MTSYNVGSDVHMPQLIRQKLRLPPCQVTFILIPNEKRPPLIHQRPLQSTLGKLEDLLNPILGKHPTRGLGVLMGSTSSAKSLPFL